MTRCTFFSLSATHCRASAGVLSELLNKVQLLDISRWSQRPDNEIIATLHMYDRDCPPHVRLKSDIHSKHAQVCIQPKYQLQLSLVCYFHVLKAIKEQCDHRDILHNF
jgi:hypothetical protein